MLDSLTPQSLSPADKAEVMRDAVTRLVRLTNGATFGGGGVTVLEADAVWTSFVFRPEKIAQFVKAPEKEKKTFTAPRMGALEDPAVLYRLVDHFMNITEGPNQICFRSKHTCSWIARPNVEGVHDWRGPKPMLNLLDMLGGSHPLTMVPSNTRPESYMRLDERLREREEANQLDIDAHHPTLLFKHDWEGIKAEWNKEPAGDLAAAKWEELCGKFRSDRRIVKHAIEYQLSLESHAQASSELEQKQKAAGLYEPALDFVAAKSTGQKKNVSDIKDFLRRVFKFSMSSLNGLHKPELLQKVIEAAKIRPSRRIDDALAQAAQRASRAAAALDDGDATAVALVEREELALDSAPTPSQEEHDVGFRKRRHDDEEAEEEAEVETEGDADNDADDEEPPALTVGNFAALKPKGLSMVRVNVSDPSEMPAWVGRHPTSFAVDTTNGNAEFEIQWLRPLNCKYTGTWVDWVYTDKDGCNRRWKTTISRDNIGAGFENFWLTKGKKIPAALLRALRKLPESDPDVKYDQFT